MLSQSVAETEKIAAEFAHSIHPGTVLFFRGDLGAGKTAFVRGLASGLGIPAEYVSSPTYTFVKEYSGGQMPLIHFDMYRVESYDDLYSIGYFDYADGKNILAVEWSENIEEFLDKPDYTITIIHSKNDNEREISIEGAE